MYTILVSIIELSKTVTIQHYFALTRARADLLKAHDMDAAEWAMLESVALADADGQQLCVTELMRMREHGSPATVHRRLVTLRKKGFVLVTPDQTDSRVKWLGLSPTARGIFTRLAEVIDPQA